MPVPAARGTRPRGPRRLDSSAMRGGARAALVLASMVAGLVAPAPAGAKARKPAGPKGWVVDRVRLENASPEGFVGVDRLGQFRGVLDVVNRGGGLAVVNEVGLEDYVRGVAEVPAAWPAEAQRAQAIAARTFALHELQRDVATEAKAVGAQICATQACQVYLGLAKERQEHGDRWVSAVESTRGQVILYRGAPILAMYSSSNGGRSVAGGRPYLRAVDDPDSARGPYGSWQVHLGYGELTSVFGLPGPLASLRRNGDGVELDWAVPEGASGRTVVAVVDFRTRLNEAVAPRGGLPRTVPSTQFAVLADDQAGTAVLDGHGHGHGIGMSQFGALGKASRGMRAPAILASYYGGLQPTTLPPDRLPATIRVALATGQRGVTAAATARFRVLDGSGAPVAVAASGAWRVLPAPRGKVRVVPPADQAGAPPVEAVTVEPPGLVGAGEARFRLAAAALVRLRIEGSGLAEPVVTAPALVEPGDAVVGLPPLPGPGRYAVAVLADAGAGRVTTVTVPLRVVRRAMAPPGHPLAAGLASPPGLPRPAAVAWVLLAVVVTALARTVARRRPWPGRPG